MSHPCHLIRCRFTAKYAILFSWQGKCILPADRTGIRFIQSEQEVINMWFYVMILSFILGMVFLLAGFSRKRQWQSKLLNGITKLSGIGLVLFAVWLGFPK